MKQTAESRVTLSVLKGPAQGSEFVYGERTTCVVGRAAECRPRLTRDDPHVSRHHCLLDINPPDVRVRDFGGPHGTFVNGEELGGPAGSGTGPGFLERDLVDGDELRLGSTLLRVGIPSAHRTATVVGCAHCGQKTPGAAGRFGDRICGTCRARPLDVVRGLLLRAAADDGLAQLRDYEVVRALRRSGPALVCLARHRGTGAHAVLTVLLAEVAVDGRARAAFLREMARVRGLRHANVVGWHHAGAFGAALCLTCDYHPGHTLEELLAARGGTLPPAQAVGIAVQILDGLGHAHAMRLPPGDGDDAPDGVPGVLVHGAIRPSNILLTWDRAGDPQRLPPTEPDLPAAGHALAGPGDASLAAKAHPGAAPAVRIAGFGLARAFDRSGLSGLTRTGAVARGLAYAPRTQLADHSYARPEADVWATAATLYRMLTGTPPREFPPFSDPLVVLLREPPVPVRRRCAAVPKRLAQVVDAALIDSPRIVTTRADEFRAALLAALG
ncbi:protein kinase domain-containing protein [Streptomyces odontomachi]|uniref:protein kinase domain-containing protein n=1 Tax=Streptomyces odontomachi TaxID=2944940 RepID=UPI00210E4400|nr:FHA domain-containing protein [Streptomyces sp. ODS25]